MMTAPEADIHIIDRAVDTVPGPWDVAEDVRLEARHLRDAVKRLAGQFVSVGVTSLGPGEGVSWVAAKLACAFAELSEPTILIEVNRRNPTQLDSFGAGPRGPSELVIPGLRCCRTTMPDLWVAGSSSQVAYAATKPKDWNVIFDFDCMSHSAEISRHKLDGVVFVVESQKQRREAVAKALERLRMSGVPILGVVINRKRQYLPQTISNLL
jgi:Mrp family chromosome partitioning ATPase